MPEALQSLIDKLQGEVVQEADAKAGTIVAEAEAEARRRLEAADADARRIRNEAERDARVLQARGEEALRQAGRDLLISVRHSVEDAVLALARRDLEAALTPDTLRELLLTMARAYAEGGDGQPMTVLLAKADRAALAKAFAGAYRDELADGLTLEVGDDITRGFRVVLDADHVEHDFTLEAIASVLQEMLRPELARLLAGDASTEPTP